MSNEECLLKLYNSYPNSHYFTIVNNKFRYISENKIEEVSLDFLKLYNLNSNIFLLNPDDIFLIIFTLEMLNHNSLTNYDIDIIRNFTIEYIKLIDEIGEVQVEDEYKKLKWNMFCIPIYTSEDPRYNMYPASKIINTILDNFVNQKEGGRNNSRVLKNPNGSINFDEDNNNAFLDYRNAGFIALALILGVVTFAVTYITTYILTK